MALLGPGRPRINQHSTFPQPGSRPECWNCTLTSLFALRAHCASSTPDPLKHKKPLWICKIATLLSLLTSPLERRSGHRLSTRAAIFSTNFRRTLPCSLPRWRAVFVRGRVTHGAFRDDVIERGSLVQYSTPELDECRPFSCDALRL